MLPSRACCCASKTHEAFPTNECVDLAWKTYRLLSTAKLKRECISESVLALDRYSDLQVAIMNQGRVMDECVGKTFIDMEDRFFNPKVAAMVEQEITPIELRCGSWAGKNIWHELSAV